MHDLDRVQLAFDPDAPAYAERSGTSAGTVEELAAELLAMTDEDQLEEFIGRLVRRGARAAGQALRSDVGRAVTGTVRDAAVGAARQAIPQLGQAVGGAIGSRLGNEDVGARIGQRLATSALRRAGIGDREVGAADHEVQFEVAQQVVRFAEETGRTAARIQGSGDPQRVSLAAAEAAARRASQPVRLSNPAPSGARTGRWVRKGDTIVVTPV
jgi:hypothetical protein